MFLPGVEGAERAVPSVATRAEDSARTAFATGPVWECAHTVALRARVWQPKASLPTSLPGGAPVPAIAAAPPTAGRRRPAGASGPGAPPHARGRPGRPDSHAPAQS